MSNANDHDDSVHSEDRSSVPNKRDTPSEPAGAARPVTPSERSAFQELLAMIERGDVASVEVVTPVRIPRACRDEKSD